MKIQPGYTLREVLDTYLVLGVGSEAYAPNCIMSVNETGAFLWHLLEQGAEKDELVAKLLDEFDVDEATAARDVDAFIAQLNEKALIVSC